jgi:hypothetical protein
MPIFRVRNSLYVFAHVPKCAGTTIEAHLADRFGPLGLIGTDSEIGVSFQHLTWAQIEAVLPRSWISGSFAVVRHPFDRFVSSYNMRVSQAHPPFPRETSIADFLDWVEARLPFHPGLLDNHLRPQVDFIGPETRLFRFEDRLDAVIDHLDECFGARPDLPPLGHYDYRDPETEKLFDILERLPSTIAGRLARLYANDFDRFGYDPSPNRLVHLKVLKQEYAKLTSRIAWRARTRFGLMLLGRRQAR